VLKNAHKFTKIHKKLYKTVKNSYFVGGILGSLFTVRGSML